MNASTSLPERIDPYRLAKIEGVVEGQCSLQGMHRLNDFLFQDQNPTARSAQVIMRFGRDRQWRVVIQGEINAELVLQCQRCLSGVAWPVATRLCLGVVSNDEAAEQLPREYDPLIVEEDISLAELVEDELILAMPTSARCEQENCPQASQKAEAGETSKNPFAVLRNMEFDKDD